MTDHDPFCQCYEPDHWCECDLIARVRADERATAQVQACDAHISQVRWAEAVAARLVGVIVQMDAEIAHERFHKMGNWRAFRETLLERDAARAEVAALRDALNVAIRLLSDVGITCTVESLFEEAGHD